MITQAFPVACGIDFGTSNSAVGWHRPGLSSLLALEEDKPTIPSAIFFHDEDAGVSYGRAALSDYLAGYDGRLMRSMKNLLGSSLIDSHTEIRGRAVPFRALLTHFIQELRTRAQHAAGREFTSVVMGRPAFFVDGDEAADKAAQDTLGEIAAAVGFTHIEFQYEPLAAAFDYESQISREELVLVIDIGGGTSDFSLIRLGPGRAAMADRRSPLERVLDHISGRERPVLSPRERASLIRRVVDEALGLGVLEPLLEDASITEIMVNGPDHVYVERAGRVAPAETPDRDHRHGTRHR